jgi:predicted DNA-binding transcriptional regulator AlpA
MGSVIENLSNSRMAIAPDTTRPIEQLKTPDHVLVSRELRPIAIHGMERFIDAGKAAEFVQLNRKTLLRFAREGSIPAHPLAGNKRRKWRFLISELDAWARAKVNSTSDRCQNSRSE